MSNNDRINVRNVYIELLNKLKEVEGVDIHYIDQLVSLLEQDIGLIEIDVNKIQELIPDSASTSNLLATANDIPAAQVNSDWNASSGVAQILNKPSLATVATSGSYTDLTNKPTIPAAQVNSDWNASSGVAQILNKPTIPAAQVNSDWNASSGVAQILNKPTIIDPYLYDLRILPAGWSSNPNSDGYYEWTDSSIRPPIFNTSYLPQMILNDRPGFTTDAERAAYNTLHSFDISNGSTYANITIYAATKPTIEIDVWLQLMT